MLDFPLMLPVNLPAVDRIQPQSNRFARDVENQAIGDSKLNESLLVGSIAMYTYKKIDSRHCLAFSRYL